MKEFFYLCMYYGFKGVIWIIPNVLMYKLAQGFSIFVYWVDRKHRHIAQVNLDLAYAESLSAESKDKIIQKTYFNLMLLLIDFVRNQGISREALLKKVHFKNENILTDALAEGRKIILMTAHYGNWELLPLAIAAKFGPLTGVGRKIDSHAIDNILNKNRQQFNIEMLDKKGALRDMMVVLKNNRMLGLLVDQNTSENEGVLVDFFTKPVRHTPSAAIMARRFDAVIIPAFIVTEEDFSHTITFYPPIYTEKTDNKEKDILDSVQKQAKITEEIIREEPTLWFWLHQRWKNQFEEAYKK